MIQPGDEVAHLREANAQLSRFAGQAAHDLQEPLRLLHGYLDVLCDHLDGRIQVDARAVAHDARDTAERMLLLVGGLLDHTRLVSQPPRVDRVHTGDALDDAIANLQLRLQETGGRVTRDQLPVLSTDRAQLARLFQNLVDNSLKYRGERAPVIHVSSTREGAGFAIHVDDNGPGFPRAGRERLFEAFTRLHSSATPGAGLGLASVRAIAERHGWTVEAADAPGGGARVTIHVRGAT